MGRSYKRNDLYNTNRAKSLREKRKQSNTKFKGVTNNNPHNNVEKYHKPRPKLAPKTGIFKTYTRPRDGED